jgi:hypothetical protein
MISEVQKVQHLMLMVTILTAPDGKIDDNDLQYLTNKKDNHYGFGFNFSTTYKRLSFSFALGGSFGGQDLLESGARSWGTSAQVTAKTNLPVNLVDHWTVDNPNAMYPAPAYRAQNGYDSDFWFVSSFNMSVRTLIFLMIFLKLLQKN